MCFSRADPYLICIFLFLEYAVLGLIEGVWGKWENGEEENSTEHGGCHCSRATHVFFHCKVLSMFCTIPKVML